jgi:hypothetical protein
MIPFSDEFDNKYYTVDDALYVDVKQLGKTKHIGNLTVNLSTKKCTLIVYRKDDERTKFGHFISAEPLEKMPIDRILIIEEGKKVYSVNFAALKRSDRYWVFKPRQLYERQVIIPTSYMKHIGIIPRIAQPNHDKLKK